MAIFWPISTTHTIRVKQFSEKVDFRKIQSREEFLVKWFFPRYLGAWGIRLYPQCKLISDLNGRYPTAQAIKPNGIKLHSGAPLLCNMIPCDQKRLCLHGYRISHAVFPGCFLNGGCTGYIWNIWDRPKYSSCHISPSDFFFLPPHHRAPPRIWPRMHDFGWRSRMLNPQYDFIVYLDFKCLYTKRLFINWSAPWVGQG